VNDTLELALTYAVSAAIGLLVGTERERKPTAKAGLRTFALIAVLGTACAMLARLLDSSWIVSVGFAVVGLTLAGAQLADPRSAAEDAGTTTVMAALLVFVLGVLNFHGERLLAVALGIGTTALLYFKTELEGAATRLTPTDIRSMLQFGAVSAVVLPLLPDRSFGPYAVLNPFHVWLMVVLISGVSLAGYVAWRLTLERKGLLLTGLLGGVISSTATTFAYARQARDGTQTPSAATVVLLLANAAMLVRVLLLVMVAAPAMIPKAAFVVLPALLLSVPALWWHFARAGGESAARGGHMENPTQLGTALLFATFYALILLAAAWLSDKVGSSGLYGLSFISGLTDVDAITLSSSRLAVQEAIDLRDAATAVGVAVSSNVLFKTAVAAVVGGRSLGPSAVTAFALPLAGLIGGLLAMRALA
jgi:uncharacterized membrane protein (DUF4010 family)